MKNLLHACKPVHFELMPRRFADDLYLLREDGEILASRASGKAEVRGNFFDAYPLKEESAAELEKLLGSFDAKVGVFRSGDTPIVFVTAFFSAMRCFLALVPIEKDLSAALSASGSYEDTEGRFYASHVLRKAEKSMTGSRFRLLSQYFDEYLKSMTLPSSDMREPPIYAGTVKAAIERIAEMCGCGVAVKLDGIPSFRREGFASSRLFGIGYLLALCARRTAKDRSFVFTVEERGARLTAVASFQVLDAAIIMLYELRAAREITTRYEAAFDVTSEDGVVTVCWNVYQEQFEKQGVKQPELFDDSAHLQGYPFV